MSVFANTINNGAQPKARPEDAQYGAFTHGKNIRTWRLKRWRAFEGGVFLGTYGTLCLPQNLFVIINNTMIQVTFVLNRVWSLYVETMGGSIM